MVSVGTPRGVLGHRGLGGVSPDRQSIRPGPHSPYIERRVPGMATLTCPACSAQVGPTDLICFTCGANLPKVRLAQDEDSLPVTVAQKAMLPDSTRRSISSAVLQISFPAGNVEVPAGTSILLGRDPAASLVA